MPTLDITVLEKVFKISAGDFSRFVQDIYGQGYNFTRDEKVERPVLMLYKSICGEPDRFDVMRVKEFRKNGHHSHLARSLLEDLCKQGELNPGDYLIEAR